MTLDTATPAAFPVMKIGLGCDVHAFAADRKLILGGVDIPHHQGLDGHSDADVLAHAVSDALLGAVRGETSANSSPTPIRPMPGLIRSSCSLPWPISFARRATTSSISTASSRPRPQAVALSRSHA